MASWARSTGLALLLGVVSAISSAQTPASGMWSFDGELNGQPGRGIQIDTQGGNLMIATYFGYREDGSATFFQASGAITDGVFSGELQEFEGGRHIAGTARSGAVHRTLGTMRVRFSSSTAGVVELPAEQPRNISRFQFVDNASRFNNTFVATRTDTSNIRIASQFVLTMTAREGSLTLDEGQCTYSGPYVVENAGIHSSGNYTCTDGRSGKYWTEGFVVGSDGTLTGQLSVTLNGHEAAPCRYKYFGACVGAWVGSDGIPCDSLE